MERAGFELVEVAARFNAKYGKELNERHYVLTRERWYRLSQRSGDGQQKNSRLVDSPLFEVRAEVAIDTHERRAIVMGCQRLHTNRRHLL